MKYIIDCDPGIDDSIAISWALSAGMDISAICCVYGNASVDECAQTADKITEICNRPDIPVYIGSNKPLYKRPKRAASHGESARGGLAVNQRFIPKIIDSNTYKNIFKGGQEITILAIGPVTNLAKYIAKDASISRMVSRVVCMGGVFNDDGNVTEYAEFNTFNDPDALQILLDSKIDTVLVPANVCRQIVFSISDITDLIESREIIDAVAGYVSYYKDDSTYGGFNGAVLYDLIAILYEYKPALFTYRKVNVQVDTTSGAKRGRTLIVDGNPNVVLVDGITASPSIIKIELKNAAQQSLCKSMKK